MTDGSESPLSAKLPFECGINFQETVKENPEISTQVMKRQRGIRKGKFEKKNIIIKEGDLLKHSKTALKKGTYRHFKLYRDALFYSRLKDDTQDNIIDIIGASIAERGTKNTSHTFSVITESRTLILSAESRREMEDWMRKMRSCAEKRIDKTDLESTQTLSGLHNWCSTTHNKPVFCNKCREVLSGASFVACEVCNIKSHQACASGITQACKWTTIESMVRDGVKSTDKSLNQPHQWLEGNLPSSSKCIICSKQCGSKKALQDWSCIWCKQCCHESCRAKVKEHCSLGKNDKLILPAKATCEDRSDLNWKITDTSYNFHPFLAFVNSRSGDNQGVKFVRRLRNLLNPLQVIDLGVTTPEPALEVYRGCKSFQILACGGDGTVGWILQCLDKFNLHKKATIIVVPLGTGNDLSRVLGWGAACNDDAKLEGILEDIPKCNVRKLDRWSVSQYPLLIPSLQTPGKPGSVCCSPLKPKVFAVPEGETTEPLMKRRRSSTGEVDLQHLQRDMFADMKPSISLPDFKNIDIPTATGLVTFTFNDTVTEEGIQVSGNFDDGEFTGTVPTSFLGSTSVNMEQKEQQDVDMDQILADQLKQLCKDICNYFPKPGNVDLAITTKLCTKLRDWTIDFLSTMEKHMTTEERDVDITASKSQALLTEMPILLNFINKAKSKKSKSVIPESELLDRCNCFLLVAQNAKFVHLESGYKAEYISLLMGLLLKASNANDTTNFKNMMQNKFREFDTEVLARSKSFPERKKRSIFQEIKNLATMNNYIGIGLDAKIALDFHNLREEHPEACKTRAQNKMWYGVFTGRQMVSKEFKNLSQRLTLECDGQEIPLPQLQGIVLLNIPSYMAGTNFWGTDKEAGSFSAPAIDDNKLEVIAVMGTSHIAESKMFGVQRHRLAQAETVKLTIRGSRKLPVQVDGEAWLQDPGVIIVRHKNKARMLVRPSKKSATNLSRPQLISRNLTNSFDNPESLCDVEIYGLVEAVEKLLEAIKILCQSKKAEFQESVDTDFILIYQKMSFTFLQAYGPDGQMIVQGMHHVRDELISSAKSLVKETLLYLNLSDTEAEMKGLITKALDVVVLKLKILMK